MPKLKGGASKFFGGAPYLSPLIYICMHNSWVDKTGFQPLLSRLETMLYDVVGGCTDDFLALPYITAHL